MLTRGKVHNVSDGTNSQDHEAIAEEEGMNDDNYSEKGSSSSKERRSEERNSFNSDSTRKLKRTPSNEMTTKSPILVSIKRQDKNESLMFVHV